MERGVRAVKNGSSWALAPHSLQLQAETGNVWCSWPPSWDILWTMAPDMKKHKGALKRAKKNLQNPTLPSVGQGFVIWIYFSQGKASCIWSDLVCWRSFQVLPQCYSWDICRILSLICSNAQAMPLHVSASWKFMSCSLSMVHCLVSREYAMLSREYGEGIFCIKHNL